MKKREIFHKKYYHPKPLWIIQIILFNSSNVFKNKSKDWKCPSWKNLHIISIPQLNCSSKWGARLSGFLMTWKIWLAGHAKIMTNLPKSLLKTLTSIWNWWIKLLKTSKQILKRLNKACTLGAKRKPSSPHNWMKNTFTNYIICGDNWCWTVA